MCVLKKWLSTKMQVTNVKEYILTWITSPFVRERINKSVKTMNKHN